MSSIIQSDRFNSNSLYFQGQHPAGTALLPAGVVCHWGAPNTVPIPFGWFLCDGSSYPVANFPDLFNAIGYAYGGSGATFNVPNVQNVNIRGVSTNFPLASTGGTNSQIITLNQMPSHTHSITEPNGGQGHTHNFYAQTSNQDGGVNRNTSVSSGFGPIYTGRATTGVTIQNAGSGTPFTMQDPYIVLYTLIKWNNEGY